MWPWILVAAAAVVLVFWLRARGTDGRGGRRSSQVAIAVAITDRGDRQAVIVRPDPAYAGRRQQVVWTVTGHGNHVVAIGRFTRDGSLSPPLDGADPDRRTSYRKIQLPDRVRPDAPRGRYRYSVFIDNQEVFDSELVIR